VLSVADLAAVADPASLTLPCPALPAGWICDATYDPNFVHRPSETTSTEPSTTLIAVCSSIA